MVDRLVVVDRIVMDSVVDSCWLMVDSVVDCCWLMVDSMMSTVVKTSMLGFSQSNVQKYEGHETLHPECS